MQKIFFIFFISLQLFGEDFDSVTLEILHKKAKEYIPPNELQYSYGSIELDKNLSYDIASYTLENGHKNISDLNFNYNYLLHYSHSKTKDAYESVATDVGVGYNIIHITEDDYVSIGTNLGIMYINAVRANERKKTNLYKLGIRISFSKQLLHLPLFIYGNTNYSEHYAYTSNKKDNGIFNEAQIGLKVKPREYTSFVFSSGVKYKLVSAKDLKIKSSVVYFGLSYLFNE